MFGHRRLKTKIGELLIERRLINRQQLAKALHEQKKNGGYVSQHLISLGFVDEKNIAECLVEQYRFAYLPLASFEINAEALKVIPFKLVNIYSLLPVEKMGNTLSVVMADPLNEGVIDMLRQTTRCNIQVFIGTYTEIRRAIDKYFAQEIQSANQSGLAEREMIKEEILNSFIQVKGFGDEKEKRRFTRKELDLDMVYFLQDKCYKAKTKNLSFSGLVFSTQLYIPIEKTIYTNIVCKILSESETISAVVQVLRVEKIEESKSQEYFIAGFYNFMNEEDKRKLAKLLK